MSKKLSDITLDELLEATGHQTRQIMREEVPPMIRDGIKEQVPGMILDGIQELVPGMMSDAIRREVPPIVRGEILVFWEQNLEPYLKEMHTEIKGIRKQVNSHSDQIAQLKSKLA